MTPRFALIFIACLASFAALAQEGEPRWYQVEVVVFLNQTAGSVSREDWSRDPGRPELRDAVTLQPIPEAAAGLMPFQLLAPDELELGGVADKLHRSGHYRALLHSGWRQPVAEDQGNFPPVLIDAPLAAPVAEEPAATPPGDAVPRPLAPAETTFGQSPVRPQAGVEGTIRLRVSRFLHLDVDLLYRKELPLLPEMTQTPSDADAGAQAAGNAAPQGAQQPFVSGLMADFMGLAKTFFQPYRLTEQRRVRRDELHYFDHPQFGIVAKVSAYEPPVPDATPAAPAAAPAPLPVPVTNPGKATAQPLQ